MKKQIHAFFSGKVQGVGFRYTALDIAGDLNVSGWVRNAADGRVELAAEAAEEVLKQFLQRLNQRFSAQIKDADVDWQPAMGEFVDFRIRS